MRNNLKGFTLVELMIGITIFGAIFVLATSIMVNILVSNTKSRLLQVLEQTKNDLHAELGNGVKWANTLSFINGELVTDSTKYFLNHNEGRLYKGDDPITPREVNISQFEVKKYSAPSEATEPDSGVGLRAEYFDNIDFTDSKLTQIDLDVDYDWVDGSPNSLIGNNTFSVRWTGQIEAPVNGNYTFYTVSDDGVRLWVNNELLVNNWTNHPLTLNSGTITLEGNKRYDIRLDYYESSGGAVIRLGWKYPGTSEQIVPSTKLYPTLSPSSLEITVGMNHRDNPSLTETLKLVVSPRGGIIGAVEPSPVDVCPNITGFQAVVPAGYIKQGTNCVEAPPPTDLCPNIDGLQTSIPAGMILQNGICVTAPPTDLCANIPGIQATVPAGYVRVGQNCIIPTPPPPSTPRPTPTPSPNPLR